MNKEIEYGIKITNPKELAKIFELQASKKRIIKITRSILKNNGKYFIKVSSEIIGAKHYNIISIKEDLLKKGVDKNMKISEEIDIPVSEDQRRKLIQMLKILGFRATSKFQKIRYEYQIKDLIVTLDKYKEGFYLEVEGPSTKKIKKFIHNLPLKLKS